MPPDPSEYKRGNPRNDVSRDIFYPDPTPEQLAKYGSPGAARIAAAHEHCDHPRYCVRGTYPRNPLTYEQLVAKYGAENVAKPKERDKVRDFISFMIGAAFWGFYVVLPVVILPAYMIYLLIANNT